MEFQSVLGSLRNPKEEAEVIVLPISTRLKAASLPPIEPKEHHLRHSKRAWASNAPSTDDGHELNAARKTTSAPMIKGKGPPNFVF